MSVAYVLRRVLLCLALVATSWSTAQSQQKLKFRHLTISDGLSQNAVYAIVQDRRGFIWFGTKDGLNRYDGYQFVVFRHDPGDSTSISDSEISAIFEDRRGQLWIGTPGGGVNRFDRRTERFERIRNGPTHNVTSIVEDASGAIWVGSAGEGLFKLTPRGATGAMEVERFVHVANDSSSIADDRVRTLVVDHNNALWIGTDIGLDRKELSKASTLSMTHYSSKSAAPFKLADAKITALHEDARGQLWIGSVPGISMIDLARTRVQHFYNKNRSTRYGWGEAVSIVEAGGDMLWFSTRSELMRFNKTTGAFENFRHDVNDPESLNSDLPTVTYRDRSDVIWVGTNGFGINIHDPKSNRFNTFRRAENSASRSSGFSVYTIFEDHSGNIWADAGLLYKWNRGTGKVQSFETSSARPEDFGNSNVWAIAEHPDGVLWAATNQGLYRHNIAAGQSRQYKHAANDASGLPERVAYDVYRDRDGSLWVLTENFLSKLLNAETGTFQSWRYKERPTDGQWVFPSTVQDAKGALWIASDQGLVRFDPTTAKLRHFHHDAREPNSISHEALRALLLDPREPTRYLWIGTAGGGLNRFDFSSEKFVHYTARDGLPNDVVYGVLPDSTGKLWLSTNKGLSRFDPVTAKFRNYDVDDGLQSNEFNSGAAFRSESGELFFGGIYGLNYFRPENIKDNPYIPAVAITGFRRGNRYETVRDSGTVLHATISESDTIRLSYHDEMLTFDFAALEYSAPVKNRYAYRMVGFNNKWFESGIVRAATYTNLPPGHYTFEVRASNNDDVWNEKGTSITLIVMPPWWRTMWAYLVYALCTIAVLLGVLRYEKHRLRLENRLEIERLEAEQLRELDRARSRLFANVSHEFRTPLTLTMGPLDDLRAGLHGALTPTAIAQVDLARRNAARVLDLINEILELARAEAGRITLRPQRVDLADVLNRIIEGFRPLAERKAIDFELRSGSTEVVAVADSEQIGRAISNLLSNAFKYTPDGGSIRVELSSDEHVACITVRDSGPGIPASDVDRVFDRFYRAAATEATHSGTGIGLALARELVALHGGTIGVKSDEGSGSTFTITLPRFELDTSSPNNNHRENGLLATAPRVSERSNETPLSVTPMHLAPAHGESPAADDTTTVLIVDDNAEIRAFIRQHLAPQYRVLEAENGKVGLDVARQQLPDLVLSDVMMPVMDGFALCKALKSDPDTEFLPVILLTARAESADVLTGLTERADDYLTKPFDVRELLLRIRNTIAIRRKLRDRPVSVASKFEVHPSPIAVTSADRVFVEQVRQAIESNLSDDSFTVERLAAEVAQSRANLHRKLREITGESPSDLIRRMRLERAAVMLRMNAGTVSEVAYAVGFKSVAHFSTAFQALHGVRPSAWNRQSAVEREQASRSSAD